MKKPKQKGVMSFLISDANVLSNRESFRSGYNKACEEWEDYHEFIISEYLNNLFFLSKNDMKKFIKALDGSKKSNKSLEKLMQNIPPWEDS